MRRSNFFIRLLSIAIFAVLLCYVGFTAYDAYINEFRTSAVYTVTVEDSAPVFGFVVRDEYIISGNGSTAVLVGNGEKVSHGQTVAASYSDASYKLLQDELDELNGWKAQLELLISGSGSTGKPVSDYVTDLSKAIASGDLTAAEGAAFEMESVILKKYNGMTAEQLNSELNNVSANIAQLNAQLGGNASYISAPESGVFFSSVDGYESLCSDDLAGLSVLAFNKLQQTVPESTSDAVGKVVTGLSWYYTAVVDTAAGAKLDAMKGKTCSILFEDISSVPYKMTVDYVSYSDNGERVVVFSSNAKLSDVSAVRDLSGIIIFDSYEAIRVSKDAVYFDEENKPYLYILRIIQAKRVDITILSESDDAYLIKSDGSVPLNAEIIVKAKNLYDGKVVQ